MLRVVSLIFLAVAVALGVGAGSVWWALQSQEGIGAVTIGGWTTFPNIGTPDADPYAKARVAREGQLALGRAEGLVFIAQRDSSGARLLRQCTYAIEGTTPTSRFWTLYIGDEDLTVLDTGRARAPAIASAGLLRSEDNSFALAISPHATPGNWLPTTGEGFFTVVLTLYDTPIASSSGIEAVELPQVLRIGCDA
jgi:hypothetical protein